MPEQQSLRSRRHAIVFGPLLALALAVLNTAALPAAANPPTRYEEIVVHLTCVAEGAFGTAYLGLEHISTNLGNPGGDLTVWAPGSDPENDFPVLSGYNRDIVRDGIRLRGLIPLRAGGEEIVGEATYDVTFAHAGAGESDVVKGPFVLSDVRYNQRFRNEKERIPLTATGVLTLPQVGRIALSDCTGQEVFQDITITAPAAKVGSARYPFGFADGDVCVAKGAGSTAYLSLAGGEAVVVIARDGEEDVVAFGFVFPQMSETKMTGSLAMFGPDGQPLGEAALRATLRTVDRDTQRYPLGDASVTQRIAVVEAEGTITFANVTYAFSGCEGVRVLERVIIRSPAKGG
jgi:hypothetical protein